MTLIGPDAVVSGAPGELLFDEPRGDCHVKYGYLVAEPYFVVKVATGFAGNVRDGLPAGGGVVVLFSRRTGLVRAILHDGGWLTDWRTAAAGSLASRALAPPDTRLVAVLGTGRQAELQAIWHHDVFPDADLVVAGRNSERTQELATRLLAGGVRVDVGAVPEAVRDADVIVTTTSATEPLFAAELVKSTVHVTAVGADGGGKQELDPELLATADLIATDDHQQCLHGGEFGNAVRVGAVSASADVALATALAEATSRPRPGGVSVADLTGLTTQDLAIASYFRQRLGLAE